MAACGEMSGRAFQVVYDGKRGVKNPFLQWTYEVMRVSSMHSGIPKLEYIPISFNFLPFFHGFGSHTLYFSWLEVPTIETVVGELEETIQALLRAQSQTSEAILWEVPGETDDR